MFCHAKEAVTRFQLPHPCAQYMTRPPPNAAAKVCGPQATPHSEASRAFLDLLWRTAAAARARLKEALGLTNAQLAAGAAEVAQQREAVAAARAEARAVRAAVRAPAAHPPLLFCASGHHRLTQDGSTAHPEGP